VSGPTRDLHSGVFGRTVHEPMTDLIALMSKLVSPDGKILIPGVEEMVEAASDEEKYVLLWQLFNHLLLRALFSLAERSMSPWITQQQISNSPPVHRLHCRQIRQLCSWVACVTRPSRFTVSKVHSTVSVQRPSFQPRSLGSSAFGA
jgi:hypothetical protein